MMVSKYNRSCIFTGAVDSLCLSCQTYLKVEDLEGHVESPQHRDTLNSINYAEKYKEDFMRKVKQGYYCEICNVVIQTVAKVKVHLSDSSHINNRLKYLMKGYNGGVLISDDIFIEMEIWHGLSDGSCFICSTDYDDEKTHINKPSHVINLIRSNIELKNKIAYRKIDENLINCLICNILVNVGSKASHIETSEHLEQYAKCIENGSRIKSQNNNLSNKSHFEDKDANPKKPSETKKVSPDKKITVSDKLTSVKRADNNYLKENESNNNNTSIAKYEEENEVVSPTEALKQAMTFAKQNHMKYKRNSTYCKACDVRISSSLKMMKEHVLDACHKQNVDKLNQTKSNVKIAEGYNKIPMIEYIDSETNIKNIIHHDTIINDRICIQVISYNMISMSGDRLRCHACEVSLHQSQVPQHKRTYKHTNAMLVTPVLADFNNEFIREVRPGVFHCGHCNFVEASLDGLRNHLQSIEHSENKSAQQRRLFRYLPMIMEERQKESMMNFFRMIHQ